MAGGKTKATRGLITPAELRQACLWAAGIMLFTCLPYLFGLAVTPPGCRYMGYVHNPDEPNAYLAWARQTAQGRWLVENKFTTEPQQPVFLNLFLVALGRTSALTHLPLIWPYHIYRLLGGFALLVLVYVFAAIISEDVLVRRAAFFLTALSSGLGWLVVLMGGGARGLRPVDFNPTGLVMPESITFLSIYLLPLFCVSMALMAGAVCLYLLALERGRARYALGGGVLFGLLANVHTYDIIPLSAVLVVFVILEGVKQRRLPTREAVNAFILGICALPAVAWQWHAMRADAAYGEKTTMTLTLALGTADHLVSFGVPLLLAVLAFPRLMRSGRPGAFIVCWIVVGWIAFKWAPFSFQRKLIEGLHIPICAAAAVGLVEVLIPRLLRRGAQEEPRGTRWHAQAAWIVAGVVAFSSLSNVAFVRVNLLDLMTNNERQLPNAMPPYYLQETDLDAMRWLETNATPNDAVLASPWVANYIPGQTGVRVVAGHWSETLGYAKLLTGVVKPFYDPAVTAEVRRAILQEYPITLVYFGPYERMLSRGSPLPKMPELQPVYSNERVTIYRVRRPQSGVGGP